jgi:hypothetical protein
MCEECHEPMRFWELSKKCYPHSYWTIDHRRQLRESGPATRGYHCYFNLRALHGHCNVFRRSA